MKTILQNCIITHEDSEVIKVYDVMMGSNAYHTGIDIKAENVYCPCKGVVIYSGLVENKPSVTIQYSPNICLRYTNLKQTNVVAGQLIYDNQNIGIADGHVHFEYLTSEKNEPNFRVFFNSKVSYFMYKHDPMLVLEGNIQFDHTPMAQQNVPQMQALYEDGMGPDEIYVG